MPEIREQTEGSGLNYDLKDEVFDLCEALGFNPDQVAGIEIRPNLIHVRLYFLQDGQKVVDHLGQPKTYLHTGTWF